MLWHLIKFILQFVPLNIELHHVLLNSRDLLLLVLGLRKFGVSLHATVSLA